VARSSVESVESTISAFNAGELKALLATFEPDAEWATTPDFPIAGPHCGHDGLERLFRGWWEAWENVSLDLEELREVGELTLVKGTFRGRARSSGEEVAVDRAWVFEVRDGLIARVLSYHDEAEALEALHRHSSQTRA
jgi:ketosteroid isomerase-like protein